MGEWMSVEIVLPTSDVDVFVTGWNYGKENTERHYALARADEDGDFFTVDGDTDDYLTKLRYITHWMAIEPPKV